ncbi:ABC transporter substrate-binding protein [Jeongeupia wiesaeckerbachi]|uniref:ABC transporter substrate-binding protein n=1 Tax=Jeongeupia wiesaeckerbachi TaxID=3051218 RepID=UPI003D801C3B
MKRVLVSLLFAAASALVQAANPAVLRVGVSTGASGSPPTFGGAATAIAQQRGVLEAAFKPDGIKVEWVFFKGAGPAANEALANRQLDFIWQGDLAAITGKAGGLKTRILLGDSRLAPNYLVVPVKSKAASLDDLKGQRLALFKGTTQQLAFNRIAAQRGLSERDFKTINMDAATTLAALAAGDVDGVYLPVNALALQERGIVRIIADTRRDPLLAAHTHLLVDAAFEQGHPQLVQKFVSTLVANAAWVSDEANREQVFTAWARAGVPVSAWRRDYQPDTLKQRLTPLLDPFFYAHYRDAVRSARQFGLIRKDIDVDAWIAPQYLREALKTQQREQFWTPLAADGKGAA